MILRIEDLDASRVRPTMARACALVDLRWLGLDWDEGPDVGGPRLRTSSPSVWRYDEALDRLKRRRAGLSLHLHPGRHRARRLAPRTPRTRARPIPAPAPVARGRRPTLGDRPFAWRFRVPPGSVAWDDLFLGRPNSTPPTRRRFRRRAEHVGPSYQLAVVVDDALMGVTQVVRGDDLVPSTPRQILLYRALGWTPPRFGHVPLVLGPDGRRLAKRDGSIKLATLREQGVDPRRLIAALARSCGWTSTLNPSRPSDWIDRYNPDLLPNAPWIMNPDEWRDVPPQTSI